MLFGKLNLESLEFDFLGEEVELAVVAHIVELNLVSIYLGLRLMNLDLSGGTLLSDFLNIGMIIGYTGMKALNHILEVAHLKGKLAAHRLDTVNLREDSLEFV